MPKTNGQLTLEQDFLQDFVRLDVRFPRFLQKPREHSTRRQCEPSSQATDLDSLVLAGLTAVARVWSGSIDCGRLARAIVPASPPPVRVTLLCRAVTLCAAVARWLRRHNGAMWYHLVHDSSS